MDEREEYAQELEQGSLAGSLRRLEEQAEAAGGAAVTPTEFREDAPSPFAVWRGPDPTLGAVPEGAPAMPSPEVRRELESHAAQVAPRSPFDPGVAANPFDTGGGVEQVLKDILEVLKSIDGKLPQTSTYQE